MEHYLKNMTCLADKNTEPTLCFPDGEKSCFACCPPIRPAGYEHIRFLPMIRRMLRENREAFSAAKKTIKPITGFSCWALGYLDERYRKIGCLLHPVQNRGSDLRFRVDYGDKCSRENCPSAENFLELGVLERWFYLRLCEGLDSFSYSSQQFNPLFRLMGWGVETLRMVADHDPQKSRTKEAFFKTYPIFASSLNSRASAYLLLQLLRRRGCDLLEVPGFRIRFENFSETLKVGIKKAFPLNNGSHFTHRLHLDTQFLDYLRLSLDISKTDTATALQIKEWVDTSLKAFPI